MRQKISAGNWKMNLTLNEGIELAKQIGESKRPKDVLTILGVPSCYLSIIKDVILPFENIECAAQNHHHLASGAHTGEISASMLSSLGIKYVILGHSERRANNNETNDTLRQKISLALEHNLKIIFCCGEPLNIREEGTQNNYVLEQLKSTIFTLSEDDMQQIIIAYEPIWAIGTGKTATSEEAQDMHQNIRQELASSFNSKIANKISILYGGSVKPSNATDIFSKSDVDGALVGGASLKAEDFNKIINSF